MAVLVQSPHQNMIRSIFLLCYARVLFHSNVYCPECPPGDTIGHPGGQQKIFLPFGHG